MRVLRTATFRARLLQIASFFDSAHAPQVFDRLLDDLEAVIFPNLARFPELGARYVDGPPQSTEAVMALSRLPGDAPQWLRKYVHDDFVILYASLPEAVHLLSVRHHRESSFNP